MQILNKLLTLGHSQASLHGTRLLAIFSQTNNSIKREQSHACMNYAERKNCRMQSSGA